MNAASAMDVPRLIRIATLLFALLAGTLVYLAFYPVVDGLEQRVDDAQATLRSDDVAAYEIPRVQLERDDLARRYEHLFAANPEAVFLRELSRSARSRHVTVLSTSVTHDTSGSSPGPSALLAPVRVTIELRGTYRDLLAAVGDLSLGSEIVDVDAPSLRRDDDAVIASIPVTIYEPDASGAAADAGEPARR